MKQLFWIAVGVGLSVLVVVKGREYLAKVTPKGFTDEVVAQGQGIVTRVREFVADIHSGMNEREAELRDALGMDEPAPRRAR